MIHYHGTPVGGEREQAVRFLTGRHALIPFMRPEDLPVVAEVCQSFCFDNSAYTAWKTGKPITDWGPYYEWVQEWSKHPGFDFAIIPDIIDGDEKANDAALAKWWRKIYQRQTIGVPVWHMHESLDRLWYLANGHYMIAIGSSGKWPNPGTQGWHARMSEAMGRICDEQGRPICKLHGLRMLDPAIFTRYPFHSADSTNAVRNGNLVKRFGMYAHPSLGQRQAIIAGRIEQHNSRSTWVSDAQTLMFCETSEDTWRNANTLKGGA